MCGVSKVFLSCLDRVLRLVLRFFVGMFACLGLCFLHDRRVNLSSSDETGFILNFGSYCNIL